MLCEQVDDATRSGTEVQVPGVKNGVKFAYNTRFGLYQGGGGGETALTAPPDRTGYAYPNKNPGSPVIATGPAYANFRLRQSLNTAFINAQYGGGNTAGNVTPGGGDYAAYGVEKRVVPVPVVDCSTGAGRIRGMVCVLMLNPMPNGNTGTLYLEFLGAAGALAGPCSSYAKYGVPGGTGTGGGVPQLLQ